MQPILFNIFVDDVGSGIECILSRLAEGIMLNDTDDSLEGQDSVLRDLDRLEEAAHMEIMKVKEQMYTHSPESRIHSGLHKKHDQQIKETYIPLLLCFFKTPAWSTASRSEASHSGLEKKGHRLVRSSPEVDHKNYQMNEEPLL